MFWNRKPIKRRQVNNVNVTHPKCHTTSKFTDRSMKKNQKSLFLTYVIWLICGWLGLHHFYLGRDIQAFIWWSTIGGFFGLGWFRDLWRIPEYVDDANDQPYFVEEFKRKIRFRKEPSFSVTRFSGQMLVGYFYGILVRLAIPEDAKWLPSILVPLGEIGRASCRERV